MRRKDALRLLSGMDISVSQVEKLLNGRTEVPVTVEQLLDNPYLASVCTYGEPEHVPFSTVDRACFPGDGADWEPFVAKIADFTDHQDERRVQALLVDVLRGGRRPRGHPASPGRSPARRLGLHPRASAPADGVDAGGPGPGQRLAAW